MNVTLALGLKYESQQRTETLPLRQEALANAPKQDLTTSSANLKSNPIIDVTPIKTVSPTRNPIINQHYDYLSYNMRATLNILQAIGTQLHITI
ncbi:MAG: hypothetical protein Q9M14_03350 [Mariprofundaceae bacterium]|nr:hypothetical protein [Mariprofundaceae bacterium]